MPTFVLVHPAWFGGWCWKKLSSSLRGAGHTVHCPTLTGLGERAHLADSRTGLDTHIEDVVSVVVYEDLEDVILVGNSSAGMVISGVADRVADRIAHVVYLDAFVPSDGQSMLDIIPPDRRLAMEALVASEGDGWLLPRFAPAPWEQFVPEAWQVTDEADLRWLVARLRPTPFRHFTDAIRLQSATAEQPHRVYIRCRLWPNPRFDLYAADAQSSAGWTHRELATSHLPFVTNPEELHEILLDLAG